MPLYYFDLLDGRLQRDETGQELSGLPQVFSEIRQTLADLVQHEGTGSLSAILHVRDADNQTVVTASISLAFQEPDTHH